MVADPLAWPSEKTMMKLLQQAAWPEGLAQAGLWLLPKK